MTASVQGLPALMGRPYKYIRLEWSSELAALRVRTCVKPIQCYSLAAMTELQQVFDGWFFQYDGYRRQFRLEVAKGDADAAFTNAMADATHVQIGDDYYAIVRADTTPPKGTQVTWKLYCEKSFQRSHARPLY